MRFSLILCAPGGSAKQARDRHFQAILPLRGKILNVERKDDTDILKNTEISSLIVALGLGVKGADSLAGLRYGKVRRFSLQPAVLLLCTACGERYDVLGTASMQCERGDLLSGPGRQGRRLPRRAAVWQGVQLGLSLALRCAKLSVQHVMH